MKKLILEIKYILMFNKVKRIIYSSINQEVGLSKEDKRKIYKRVLEKYGIVRDRRKEIYRWMIENGY